jgi:hypothetical protein
MGRTGLSLAFKYCSEFSEKYCESWQNGKLRRIERWFEMLGRIVRRVIFGFQSLSK